MFFGSVMWCCKYMFLGFQIERLSLFSSSGTMKDSLLPFLKWMLKMLRCQLSAWWKLPRRLKIYIAKLIGCRKYLWTVLCIISIINLYFNNSAEIVGSFVSHTLLNAMLVLSKYMSWSNVVLEVVGLENVLCFKKEVRINICESSFFV